VLIALLLVLSRKRLRESITIYIGMDSIVAAVIKKFADRSEVGIKKYGVTLDRTDLKTSDWIQHTQEELMDAILYLEKLKQGFPKDNEKS
jgi:hypothetical protein